MRRDSRVVLPEGERGAIGVIVALALVPIVLGACALGVDLSVVRLAQVSTQNAADAAALAGVVHLPANPAAARSTALQVAAANGLDAGATKVEVVEDAAARLRVTTDRSVSGAFASALGARPLTIRRTAIAEYAAPLLLGSPCNVFGREDMSTVGGGDGQAPQGTAQCEGTGNYWAGVMGAGMDKSAGDAYTAAWCTWPDGQPATDGCDPQGRGPNPPGKNLEFRPGGHTFLVRVQQPGVLRVQGYDMSWVSAGPLCRGVLGAGGMVNPLAGSADVLVNEFVAVDGDTNDRYAEGFSAFCTGDTQERYPFADDSTEALAMTTSATLTPAQGEQPQPLCPTAVFPGIEGLNHRFADVLQPGAAGDLGWEVRRTFHRWVDLCPGVQVQPGDYRLRVETGPGSGANRFGLRAWVEGHPGAATVAAEGSMHVYSNFVNGSSQWHLVRLDDTAAGRTVEVSVFDLGDAEQPIDVELLEPESGNVIGPCRVRGALSAELPRCAVTVKRSLTNARWVHFEIPVPSDYRCPADADMSRCWLKARVTTSAAMFDATTWTARVLGDPVRLVQ